MMRKIFIGIAILLFSGISLPMRAEAGSRGGQLRPQSYQPHAWPRPARSAQRGEHDDARRGVEQGEILPLDVVLRGVRSRYPGRLLDAHLTGGGSNPRYKIKMLTNNGSEVVLVTCDARTGSIIGVRGGGR